MSLLNVILLILGIFNIFVGILMNKICWMDIVTKIVSIFGGAYLIGYSLYLSNILLIIKR